MHKNRSNYELAELAMRFAEKCRWAEHPPALMKLKELVARHDAGQGSTGERIAEWKRNDPGTFWPAAFHLIRHEGGLDGNPALRAAIQDFDDLVDLLLDLQCFDRDSALVLATELLPHSPSLDVRLVRRAKASCYESQPNSEPVALVLRTLDVIGQVSDPVRIPPLVTAFSRIKDKKVESKITMLLARSTDARDWLRARLAHPDPRTRANAVEGLWDIDFDAEMRAMLWLAADDSHHRVVANALVALGRAGNRDALNRIIELSGHASVEFRAAAAWAMGEIGDPHFIPALQNVVRSEAGGARRNAMKALVRIRKNSRARMAS